MVKHSKTEEKKESKQEEEKRDVSDKKKWCQNREKNGLIQNKQKKKFERMNKSLKKERNNKMKKLWTFLTAMVSFVEIQFLEFHIKLKLTFLIPFIFNFLSFLVVSSRHNSMVCKVACYREGPGFKSRQGR